MTEFNHTLIDFDENGILTEVGTKTLYNLDGTISINDWTKDPVKNLKTEDEVNLASAIIVSDNPDATHRGRNFKGNFGYYHTENNGIMCNGQGISLMSSAFSHRGGHGINADNFLRCCSAFAARRLIKGDWINDKDEYMKPNTDDPRYPEFEADSLVFSLFDSNSQQSSLRGVEYRGKKCDVKNEFFWMSRGEIMKLADENGLESVYSDALASNDRHMAKVLNGASLSTEAKAVLEKASGIVRKTFRFRKLFDDEHPEYQLCSVWDAGWYQVKAVAKQYLKEDYEEFRKLFKALGDKMRPMVYELGFLRG